MRLRASFALVRQRFEPKTKICFEGGIRYFVQMISHKKSFGQYFTPSVVAGALVSWVIENPRQQLLDPSCGDGQFLVHHKRSVGVELDPDQARKARDRSPGSLVHGGEFFTWSCSTKERFDAIAGNPPFIRYQSFTGEVRAQALACASLMGADFSAMTSSWAPFVIVAAGLLKPGGKMAFVVPAEIGHANYAQALIPALCNHFGKVHIVACREKLFPELSEDCWLLHCSGFGSRTSTIQLSVVDRFVPSAVAPKANRKVSLARWRAAGGRLRPFILSSEALGLYHDLTAGPDVRRLGELAATNIGYVSGANDFFHLRPSEARRFRLPDGLLRVTVRKSAQLPSSRVTVDDVKGWVDADKPVLLLDLNGIDRLPKSVRDYIDSEPGEQARQSYKCRNRRPWYAVPDIKVPDGFLSVMNGGRPQLIRNDASCVCTNSLHTVRLKSAVSFPAIQRGWNSPLTELGTELEGHPLGGGMLKLEPREAASIPVPIKKLSLGPDEGAILLDSLTIMRQWRHHA
ncbi:MAG: adenine-specific DNA-methyltransferase [Verrucomicrobiales bacterium]